MKDELKKDRRRPLEKYPSIVFKVGNPRKSKEPRESPLKLRNFSRKRIFLWTLLLTTISTFRDFSGEIFSSLLERPWVLLLAFFVFTPVAILIEAFALIERDAKRWFMKDPK